LLNPNRRGELRMAIGRGVALSVAGISSTRARAADGTKSDVEKKVRLGVIGVGARGTDLLRAILKHPGVEVLAICDINEAAAKRAQDIVEKELGKRPEGYSKDEHDYRRMLARDDLNAVMIVTPHDWHGPMTIDSLKVGKFVGSEVPGCVSVDECWEIIRTQQQTGSGYMLLENYCYSQPAL